MGRPIVVLVVLVVLLLYGEELYAAFGSAIDVLVQRLFTVPE